MNMVSELDLLDLGLICGVIGEIEDDTKTRFVGMMKTERIWGIMFCFRGEIDIAVAESVLQIVCEHACFRSVMIYNPSIERYKSLAERIYLERLLERVDVAVDLNWSIRELQIAVAIYCDRLVIAESWKDDLVEDLVEIDCLEKVLSVRKEGEVGPFTPQRCS